jgi:quercetin dioxygenase-like cupin family protein
MNIQKLKELTETLPKLPLLEELVEWQGKGYTELSVDAGGPVISLNCYKTSSIAIVRVFAEQRTKIKFHTHAGYEYIIVYQGQIQITFETDEVFKLKKNDFLSIPPNMGHQTEWIENSWFVAIIIPAAEGHPNGK